MSIYNKKYGEFIGSKKGYSHLRNILRTKKFTEIIDPQKDENILDIGCNKGLLLFNLAKYTDGAVGVDINKELVEKMNNSKIQFMSATELRFPKNYFEKVCAFEVVEHIVEINKVFVEVYNILKIGGRFIISFPLEIVRGQSALIEACFVYKNPLYARKIHVHKLTPVKIKKIVADLPFSIIETKIVFIPFPSFVVILRKEK